MGKEMRRRVAFLHPELGLGGAERLVIDAALELVAAGHTVHVYTTFHDPEQCIEETRGRAGGFKVSVAGNWFPSNVAGKCQALCTYIRCILAALYMAWLGWTGKVRRGASCMHYPEFAFASRKFKAPLLL